MCTLDSHSGPLPHIQGSLWDLASPRQPSSLLACLRSNRWWLKCLTPRRSCGRTQCLVPMPADAAIWGGSQQVKNWFLFKKIFFLDKPQNNNNNNCWIQFPWITAFVADQEIAFQMWKWVRLGMSSADLQTPQQAIKRGTFDRALNMEKHIRMPSSVQTLMKGWPRLWTSETLSLSENWGVGLMATLGQCAPASQCSPVGTKSGPSWPSPRNFLLH